jgi:hypothetical protein
MANGVNGDGGMDSWTGNSLGATGNSRTLALLDPAEEGRRSGDEMGGRSGEASSSSGI